jgi:tetratricopeptide (TPR) repeat protein
MRINNNQNKLIVRPELWICLFLVLSTLLIYFQVSTFEFVNFDTANYVYENRHVKAGLTAKGIKWAFTTISFSNWHPLTWLSHMLDVQLYGLHPGRHHMTNALLHVVNTLLLFFVLRRMTGALWQSGFVAALFALHPLHVESVAWVAERKDLLSALFGLLALWFYTRYAQAPKISRYLPVLLFFILGLMAKPMVVTLPFLLLLLDFWPLRRLNFATAGKIDRTVKQGSAKWLLIVEKLPLFIISTASCMATLYAKHAWGAFAPLDKYPLGIRIANALTSYASYINKMIWPVKLAMIYPYDLLLTAWQILKAGGLIGGITLLSVKYFKTCPWFSVGWFWFLGTLVPVIGLVQVGAQSMADRYTYVPLIGLFIIIAWGLFGFLARWSHQKYRFAVIALVISGVLMAVAWQQIGYWKNSVTLSKRTIDVTQSNYIAEHNLGHALLVRGRFAEAAEHIKNSLEINPQFVEAHYNMAVLLELQGKPEKALESYQKALSIKPGLPIAKRNLAFIQAASGNYETAIEIFKEIMIQNPDLEAPYYYIAAIYSRQDKIDQSIHWLKKAVAKGYDDWENLQQDRNFNKIRNTSYYKKLMEDNVI